MAGTKIDQRSIEKHVKEINKAYERAFKKYPIIVPLGGRNFTASAGATGLGVGIEQDPQLVRYLIWLGQRKRHSGATENRNVPFYCGG